MGMNGSAPEEETRAGVEADVTSTRTKSAQAVLQSIARARVIIVETLYSAWEGHRSPLRY